MSEEKAVVRMLDIISSTALLAFSSFKCIMYKILSEMTLKKYYKHLSAAGADGKTLIIPEL